VNKFWITESASSSTAAQSRRQAIDKRHPIGAVVDRGRRPAEDRHLTAIGDIARSPD